MGFVSISLILASVLQPYIIGKTKQPSIYRYIVKKAPDKKNDVEGQNICKLFLLSAKTFFKEEIKSTIPHVSPRAVNTKILPKISISNTSP